MSKNKKSHGGKGKTSRKKDPLRAKKDAVDIAIVGIGVVLGLVLGMIFFNVSQSNEGQKIIGYEVHTSDTDSVLVKVTVKCDDLYTALDNTEGFEMSESGVLVTANSREADREKGEYWCVLTDGTDVTDSLKETAIKDGQKIEIWLKTK